MKRAACSHAVFDSKLGPVAVAWSAAGLVGVQLPEATRARTAARLASRAGSTEAPAPPWVRSAVDRMRALIDGKPAQLEDVRLDDAQVPEFHGRVYAALRKLPAGSTCTYGELARAAGSPNAARAVGQAMRRNPWPLVVPCHRVLASEGRLGGFSAHGGLELKARLLRAESRAALPSAVEASAAPKPRARKPGSVAFDSADALAHLREADPKLAPLLARVPYDLTPSRLESTFEALLRTIVYQQLSGKAASTIHGRVLELLPEKQALPRALLDVAPERLRAAGLSHSKIASARDLAARTLAGELPSPRELERMDDEQIVERLTVVRGIGRWSVEMLLMFRLGRPDVLPTGDFGVRQGFMLLMKRKEMPTPEQLERHARRWKPYRSVASWYMWRAVEEARARAKLGAGGAAKKRAQTARAT